MFEVQIETLREELHKPFPVKFSYKKVDGTKRDANGTLNENLIPEDMKPKDSSTNKDGNLRYFDLDKNAWRSLSKDASLVTIFE